jgi:hypothetical protein
VKGTTRPGSYQVTARPASETTQHRHAGRQVNSKDTRSIVSKSQTDTAARTSSQSKQSPLEPVDGVMPACLQRPVNRTAVYCLGSTGRRNSHGFQ